MYVRVFTSTQLMFCLLSFDAEQCMCVYTDIDVMWCVAMARRACFGIFCCPHIQHWNKVWAKPKCFQIFNHGHGHGNVICMKLPILCIEYTIFKIFQKVFANRHTEWEEKRANHCPTPHTFVFNYAIYIQLISFPSHSQNRNDLLASSIRQTYSICRWFYLST